ncbi:L-ascorbate metabolism protein UlaG, beta-lactamase superfamily [Caloramator quimbayensis]|uniref:L-ascorbate metabolism protein UlaG, beta-lactamase superfamily n=1 Tax=Caloramator quimbayensis TaxID=1147123 RepID=A0A1T4WGY8_9CLOT|nr:MBL fold metallo-hydrolase [Caloramator quimbayensis]SKA76218.1 L-ascorbate metabolism protein UlaG, beta-lactamase superfamily [Caloramator quimbayensis]
MRIKWLGHACFKITMNNGVRILTDPFDDNVGYKIPSVEADIVTISHNHYDHNFTDCIKGNFEVVDKVGNFYIKDIVINGIHTYHDEVSGAKRGNNTVYVFEHEGIRLCHLGDLGHVLSDEQIKMLGKIDILLIPVGGVYTINADEALHLVEKISPKVVIPMHYKTPVLKFNLDDAEKFLKGFNRVERLKSQVVEIKNENLNNDETLVYVLNYE